jgi:hypothetical protein
MNVNSSNIARDRTASSLELPNNLHREPRKTIEFRPPHAGPLRPMQNVNRTAATTSKSPSGEPLVQNSKIPERQTILLQVFPTNSAKLPAAQNPGGEFCAARHFPQNP